MVNFFWEMNFVNCIKGRIRFSEALVIIWNLVWCSIGTSVGKLYATLVDASCLINLHQRFLRYSLDVQFVQRAYAHEQGQMNSTIGMLSRWIRHPLAMTSVVLFRTVTFLLSW